MSWLPAKVRSSEYTDIVLFVESKLNMDERVELELSSATSKVNG